MRSAAERGKSGESRAKAERGGALLRPAAGRNGTAQRPRNGDERLAKGIVATEAAGLDAVDGPALRLLSAERSDEIYPLLLEEIVAAGYPHALIAEVNLDTGEIAPV